MICPACSATYPWDTRFCSVDGSTLRPIRMDTEDLVGRIIDERYAVLQKLGQGGMGEVYLGEHVLTRRRVAIKLVRQILAGDPEAYGRFIREATNAGRINHPHVATVYDFGKTDDGMLYLAMEYVDGESLADLLEREKVLPPARAVAIARQVAEAVGAAHELDIVHRDLKPGNILLARDRRGGDVVKVVDFGIARMTTDDQQYLTRAGMVVGTPEYMSPEQLIGDPVDGRADIYALGCIMYQMLTGEHAFAGSTARLLTRRLTEKPPHPRDTNPDIPKPLDDIVVTALGRSPQDRFQTMDELRDALVAAPVQAVTTGPRRLAAWLGRKSEKKEPSTGIVGTAERLLHSMTREQKPGTGATTAVNKPVTRAATRPATRPVEQPPTATTIAPSSMERATGVFAGAAPPDGVPAETVTTSPEEPFVEVTPRKSVLPKVAVAATAVIVLLVVVVALRQRPDDPVSQAPATEPIFAQPPAPPSPDSLLAVLTNELAIAAQEDIDLQYSAAIGRLRLADSTLQAMLLTYPNTPEVRALADTTAAHLARVRTRCNADRTVALQRNETPPICE